MRKGTDFEISKEVYDRAKANRDYITKEDQKELFDISILCGYGLYDARAYEKDGKYYCSWYCGSSCD